MASGAGCSTKGYDPSAVLRREGASERDIRTHVQGMPSFLREEQVHGTPHGRSGSELLTFCREGKLQSMILED